jgi:hypothetical protein
MRKLMTIGAVLMVGVASVAGAQMKTVHEEAQPKPSELRRTVNVVQHDVVLRSTRDVEILLEASFEPAPYVD